MVRVLRNDLRISGITGCKKHPVYLQIRAGHPLLCHSDRLGYDGSPDRPHGGKAGPARNAAPRRAPVQPHPERTAALRHMACEKGSVQKGARAGARHGADVLHQRRRLHPAGNAGADERPWLRPAQRLWHDRNGHFVRGIVEPRLQTQFRHRRPAAFRGGQRQPHFPGGTAGGSRAVALHGADRGRRAHRARPGGVVHHGRLLPRG